MSRRGSRAGATLVALALLGGGCGRADAPDVPGETSGHDFSTATREQLAADPDGRTFRVMIESHAEATWPQANRAMWDELGIRSGCIEGDPEADVERTPATESDGYLRQRFPAGTRFVKTFRCVGPFDDEYEVAAGVGYDEAVAQVEAILAGDGERDDARHLVIPLRIANDERKYREIDDDVGGRVTSRLRTCDSGQVVLRRLVVAAMPPGRNEENGEARPRILLVGTDIECLAAPATGGS